MNIEHASATSGQDARSVIARAPDHVRRAINAKRLARGLEPIASSRDYAVANEARLAAEAAAQAADTRRGTGVWIEQGGRLVPAGTSPIRSTSRSTTPAGTKRGTRVLILVAFGDAEARAISDTLPEGIAHNAFGTAAELNASPGWTLRAGHEGHLLQMSGERLRAHDTAAGLVVEWRPDMTNPWSLDAVRAIESGENATSVAMLIKNRRTIRVPRQMTIVLRAKLLHVALLRGDSRPSYAGARAKAFEWVEFDDANLLRKQIKEVIERGRWYARKAEQAR